MWHTRTQAALDIYEWLVAGRDVNSPIPADIETYNILIQACHQVRVCIVRLSCT